MDGLENLTTIGGYLGINHNDALTSLDGLEGLTTVGGYLSITFNSLLTNTDGLSSLTSIAGNLRIYFNQALTNIDGLAGLTEVGQDLIVHLNYVLAECTIGLAPLLLEGELGGDHYIAGNAPGCNSYWEAIGGNVDVEDEATPLVTGLAAPYPNPTAGTATVSFTLAEPAEVTLTLYDALGRRLRMLAEGPQSAGEHEVALSPGLPAGTYVVRFEADEQSWTERVTVVR